MTRHSSLKRLKLSKKVLIGIIVGICCIVITAGVLIYVFVFLSPSDKFGAVVSNGEGCSEVGKSILSKGGYAVDAAIAVLFCEGIKMPQSMGLGGGFIMTLYKRDIQTAYFINAREMAPLAASEDMFQGDKTLSQSGIHAVAVPGELRGYWEVYKRYGGGVSWQEILEPSIRLCEEGFKLTKFLGKFFKKKEQDLIRANPGLKKLFVNSKTDQVYKEGELLKLPHLAKFLRTVSEKGGDVLHNGDLTDLFVEGIRRLGGNITKKDMNEYEVSFTEAVMVPLPEGKHLYTVNLPGSGPMVAFMLEVLTQKGLKPDPEDKTNYQRIIEAFKFAYGKRSHLGDPNFLDNVKELMDNLTSPEKCREVADKINDTRTFDDITYYGGEFYNPDDHGTANLCVLAPNGDAVSVTSTINGYFGSKVVLEELGLILNNEMDDFSSPNITNLFGLKPSVANFIKPKKRPLSSMSPSIIVGPSGDVELIAGGAGGTKITTSVTLTILHHTWFNRSINDSIQMPRFHHQLTPMVVTFEREFEHNKVVEELSEMGHAYEFVDSEGFSAVTGLSNRSGVIEGAYDRRRGGSVSYLP